MRILLVFAVALGSFAACGGKKSPGPTNVDRTPPDKTEKSAAGAQCCCEFPSDPATFEMHDSKDCHEDSHGVCQDDNAKCKK